MILHLSNTVSFLASDESWKSFKSNSILNNAHQFLLRIARVFLCYLDGYSPVLFVVSKTKSKHIAVEADSLQHCRQYSAISKSEERKILSRASSFVQPFCGRQRTKGISEKNFTR